MDVLIREIRDVLKAMQELKDVQISSHPLFVDLLKYPMAVILDGGQTSEPNKSASTEELTVSIAFYVQSFKDRGTPIIGDDQHDGVISIDKKVREVVEQTKFTNCYLVIYKGSTAAVPFQSEGEKDVTLVMRIAKYVFKQYKTRS